MADKKIFSLNTQAGIQRDGTSFNSVRYVDGQWVRFHGGKPKKMKGYREINDQLNGPTRGIHVWSRQDLYQITTMSQWGIECTEVDQNAVGSAIYDRTPAGFVANPNLVYQFDTMYDSAAGSNKSLILIHAGQNLANIDSGVTSEVYYGDVSSTDPLLSIGPTSAVSGGLVAIAPYLVLYGSDGLVRWSNQNEPRTLVTTTGDAGTARITGAKIVKGLPIRGSGQSPAALLWSTDSLYRMSYIGGQAVFRFDPVSSQTSVLSSSGIIEYDGAFFWAGIDRFMVFAGGAVQELPNDTNLEFFYDNLNYAQRQKVHVTKVPQYGEIWWHFPFGNATECTHAVIYNIREKSWYDVELPRSASYYSQTFRFPVKGDAQAASTVVRLTLSAVTGAFNEGDIITGGSTGATGTVIKLIGNRLYLDATGTFVVAETISSGAATGTVGIAPETVDLCRLWQHEFGKDRIQGGVELAIPSFFETADFGLPTGGSAQEAPIGDNRWTRVTRIEPDFRSTGDMSVKVVGSMFAQGVTNESDAFVFNSDTEHIDIREQRRVIRLVFENNAKGGDYEMGRVLLHLDVGDGRG